MKPEKAINSEQLAQIFNAIAAGKYSWACVLFIRFSGYDPMDYIPYNTYNRLLKQNCQIDSSSLHRTDNSKTVVTNTLKQGLMGISSVSEQSAVRSEKERCD